MHSTLQYCSTTKWITAVKKPVGCLCSSISGTAGLLSQFYSLPHAAPSVTATCDTCRLLRPRTISVSEGFIWWNHNIKEHRSEAEGWREDGRERGGERRCEMEIQSDKMQERRRKDRAGEWVRGQTVEEVREGKRRNTVIQQHHSCVCVFFRYLSERFLKKDLICYVVFWFNTTQVNRWDPKWLMWCVEQVRKINFAAFFGDKTAFVCSK